MKDITSVLYYPNIEFVDVNWLKYSLLLWDNVYRIVPRTYTPQDSYPIKVAVSKGCVRSVNLEKEDFLAISKEFQRFLKKLPFLPAGLDGSRTDRLHKEKIDSQLYPTLESLATRIDENGFLELPSDLSRGYMMYLAQAVAERRNLATATDNRYSWTISAYYRDRANYSEHVYNSESEGYYTSLIFCDIIPGNLYKLDISDIIKFAQKRKDERSKLRTVINDFAQQLSKCESSSHINDLREDFKKQFKDAVDDFKRSMSFFNPDVKYALLTLGLPVSAGTLGALSLGGDPFDPLKICSSVLFGAVAAYAEYQKIHRQKLKESHLSYLLDIDKELIKRDAIPDYHRIFEEFIND